MRDVPLTVRVSTTSNPYFTVEDGCLNFQGDKFKARPIFEGNVPESLFFKLLRSSSTVFLFGDSPQLATRTLRELLNFGSALDLASLTVADVCKNRSYVDVLSADKTRKFLKKMPLNRLLKKIKLTEDMVDLIFSLFLASCTSSLDLVRFRSATVATINHSTLTLTVVDLSGQERLNGFCRANDDLAEPRNRGVLSGFVFDLVPTLNTRYILHFDQESKKATIAALLGIFGTGLNKASTLTHSDSARSSSPFGDNLPNYARPTKSSVAPKTKNRSCYVVTKPKLQKKVNSRNSAFNVHLIEKLGTQRKDHNAAAEKRKQLSEELASLRYEQVQLRNSFITLREFISDAKSQADAFKLSCENRSAQQATIMAGIESQELDKEDRDEQFQAELDELKENSRAQIADYESKLSEANTRYEERESSLATAKNEISRSHQKSEVLEKEKRSLETQNDMLLNSKALLEADLQQLQEQMQKSASTQDENLKCVMEENRKLSATIHKLSADESLQKQIRQKLEMEISALKNTNKVKNNEIVDLFKYKNRAAELETLNSQLQRELSDTKAQYSGARFADTAQTMASTDDVSKIFGYADVDIGNISSSFSPITGFDHLSQIEFPNVSKKIVSRIVSSPNRVLRQSNVRFTPPDIGKLASSPARKDLGNWEDIENQN